MPEQSAAPAVQQAITQVNREYEERAVIQRGQELNLPTVDLRRVEINVDLFYVIAKEQAEAALAIPYFRIGKKLRLAAVEPDSPATRELIDQLHRQGFQVGLTLTSKSGLLETLPQYDTALIKKQEQIVNTVDEANLDDFAREIQGLRQDQAKIEAAAPDVALNYIMVGSMRTQSSDVHLEPEAKDLKVRLRIDGLLQDVLTLDLETGAKIIQAVKHLSHLKFNVTTRPQDGRFSFVLNQRTVDVRVSTLPSIHGESVVMRLLDSGRSVRTLADLGLTGRTAEVVERAVRQPRGMIITTGPTGSGKTTTQYAILHELNAPDVKIITLEDPVEYRVDGIIQSQIDEESSFGFADALRAVLRHDPDVVMVGEIRDRESAEIAAQASLTGHTVLSTLHTNDAVGAISRLINMGLPTYVVAPALGTVIAQRLVRRVCPSCRVDAALGAGERAEAETMRASLLQLQPDAPALPGTFVHGTGCEACSRTGFKGQVGLYEVFSVTHEIQDAILKNDTRRVYELARADGMLSLREDGLQKALSGLTTIGEVLRVTMDI